jgi:hypothetical protein
MHEHLIWDIRSPAMAAKRDQGPEITLCNCFRMNYGRWKSSRQLRAALSGRGDARSRGHGASWRANNRRIDLRRAQA